MKAMILAAGLGERMRPLTDTTAKPLLPLGPKRIIEYHLEALVDRGVDEVVISVSRDAKQIISTLGDGSRYGLTIHYSYEGEKPIGTGAGVFQALSLLGDEPFLLLSGDVWTDFPLATLLNKPVKEAYLVMVDNPVYHPCGDFSLLDNGTVTLGDPKFTYGNIALLHPKLFAHCKEGQFELAPLLQAAIEREEVEGELYAGCWHNIGTPQQLAELSSQLSC
jgi:MurNAc alpha-1-phosphate uridylyltransferase